MPCKKKDNCCVTTVTQKSINDQVTFTLSDDGVLTLIIGNKIYTVPLDLSNTGGGSANPKITLPITSNGQSSFVNVVPSGQQIVGVYLNGVLQDSTEYSVPTNTTNLLWLSTQQPLETSDRLQIELITIEE